MKHFVTLGLSASGVLFNVILIILTFLKFSPTVKKRTLIVIFLKCTLDVAACVVNIVFAGRLVSAGGQILLISEEKWSYVILFSGNMVLWTILQYNLIWQAVSFSFRHYTIHYSTPTTQTFLITALFFFAPLSIHCFLWISSFIESMTADPNFLKFAPRILSKPGDTVIFGVVLYQASIVSFSLLSVLSIGIFSFCVVIRTKLVRFIVKNASRISRTSLVLNERLLKTITCQSLIPAVTFLSILFFLGIHFSILEPFHFQHFPSSLLISTCFISPISYLLFLPKDFNFCFGDTRRRRKTKSVGRGGRGGRGGRVGPISTVSTSLPMSIF